MINRLHEDREFNLAVYLSTLVGASIFQTIGLLGIANKLDSEIYILRFLPGSEATGLISHLIANVFIGFHLPLTKMRCNFPHLKANRMTLFSGIIGLSLNNLAWTFFATNMLIDKTPFRQFNDGNLNKLGWYVQEAAAIAIVIYALAKLYLFTSTPESVTNNSSRPRVTV